MITGLRFAKEWQVSDHVALNAPEGTTIKIVKRASRWHLVIKVNGVEVHDQKVPTLDYGMAAAREYVNQKQAPQYLAA